MNQSNILIVDDEPVGRKTLKAHLAGQDYNLVFVGNGTEALAQMTEFSPDVILLDVMMPGVDGFELCQRLKTDEHWRHIPIILVTALNSKHDVARGLDAGADEFLSKPVTGLELRARIRSMLRIKKQYDELAATLQLREDLVNMIVHDMRNPLTVILGFSGLLKAGTITSDNVEDLAKLHQQALRLNSFVNDILMLAKMEQGKLILNRSVVNIKQLVQVVEENYSSIARSKKINLVVNLPQQSRPVLLDANLFRRVLDNLLSNALKFSLSEDTVILWIEYPETQKPRVRIKVLDEGPGIAIENRERIFNKFEVAGIKQKGTSQVGLGLAFCKMVVEAHGGRIFVETNEPKGSVFTVEI